VFDGNGSNISTFAIFNTTSKSFVDLFDKQLEPRNTSFLVQITTVLRKELLDVFTHFVLLGLVVVLASNRSKIFESIQNFAHFFQVHEVVPASNMVEDLRGFRASRDLHASGCIPLAEVEGGSGGDQAFDGKVHDVISY
jgi:hypothetical protein